MTTCLGILLALAAGPPGPACDVKKELDAIDGAASLALQGRGAEARDEAEKAFAAVRREAGDRHARYAEALGMLAWFHEAGGDAARALPLRRRQEEVLRDLGGPRWGPRLDALGRLAGACRRAGRPAEAERHLRAVLAIAPPAGAWDSTGAKRLTGLGLAVLDQGRSAEAAALFERAIDLGGTIDGANNAAIAYEHLGDYRRALRRAQLAGVGYEAMSHLSYLKRHWGMHLVNLGGLLHRMGDHDEADRAFTRGAEVFTGALADHPDHAVLLNNRAHLLLTLGKPKEALPLLEKALGLVPAGSPAAAVYRHNVGRARLMLGELAVAAREMEAAQTLRRAHGRGRHPQYAHGLLLQSILAARKGDVAGALALAEHATDIYRDAAPANLSQSLNAEAVLYLRRGDTGQAARRAGAALRLGLEDLRNAAENLPERLQLTRLEGFRAHLDLSLSLGGAGAYPHVLAAKGLVLDRQRRAREAARASRNPLVRTLAIRLDEAARRLAAARNERAFLAAARRVEDLERELAERIPAEKAETPTPEALAARLPEGAALVDVIAFNRRTPTARPGEAWRSIPSLAAFVVRRGKAAVRVDLGESARVEAAVNAWREAVSKGSDPGKAGDALAALLLRPLRPHLAGVKTLLVSPDGPTARIPWGALPGAKAGTYLLEELAVALVPIPRLIRKDADPEPASRSLLVVGEVNFDDAAPAASPGGASAMRGRLEKWHELPATRGEATDTAASFRAAIKGSASVLRGKEATEAAVRERLPGRTHVHFATHGFFAAPSAGGARVTPGLLSGLVLAGANKPMPGGDDGILTASEVAEMDLTSCRLAVLSACETGLGPSAGGEGLLGLQRAFQIAGARSVAASLWKVPDASTSVLMARFYANLWRKGMPKAEALREAQLFVLSHGARHPELVRGMALASGTSTLKPKGGRLPPLHWAAWVLSGDWR
jgi:CHAT domain-containing protein/Tfp pilus assembly protein PilF